MFKKASILAIILIMAFCALGQPNQPVELWTNIYGGNDGDWGNCVLQTQDGGLIFTGMYGSNFFQTNQKIYLIKTDQFGNTEWEQTYGTVADTSICGNWIESTTDGGYIIAGEMLDPIHAYVKAYMLKIDGDGNQLWSNTFGFGGPEEMCSANSVRQTADGGFILAGSIIPEMMFQANMYLVKTDPNGIFEWSMEYGGELQEDAFDVEQTPDGGYILVGETYTYGPGDGDIYVVKTDPYGAEEWSLNFGGDVEDEAGYAVLVDINGDYIITGKTTYFGSGLSSSAFMAKVDQAGNLVSFNDLGGAIGYSIQATDDGGYIIGGLKETITDENIYLVKTDADGNVEWNISSGDPNILEVVYSVIQTNDGGYVTCGQSRTMFPFSNQAQLMKFEYMNELNITLSLEPDSLPIVIPQNGGSFNFNIGALNNEADQVMFDVWTFVTLPSGEQYGPIILCEQLILDPLGSVNRDRTQDVPVNAPSGLYTYDAYAGIYPDIIMQEDHFEFSKSELYDNSIIVTGWNCWGEEFDFSEDKNAISVPQEFAALSSYPNPFNPTTTISFKLAEAANIELSVFDINGRVVANIIEGFQSAGSHEITFNASHLASGIYFARLSADDVHLSQKLLLLK